ncbi:MAG: hypothetical protein PVH21_18045 [Myxococcales bacterium]|jgi:hypothetical protein
MRRALPYLAGILIYVITPGSSEIVENVLHLLSEGHAAHAVADAEHAPRGAEHGCSGTFHLCHCHSSTAFVGETEAPEIEAAAEHRQLISWEMDDARAEGCPVDMFRPPSA